MTSEKQKFDMIKSYVTKYPNKKVLVFTETKEDAKKFAFLDYARFTPIHGDLDQARRRKILSDFAHPKSKNILVATDVAARGLDIEDIDAVFQFDVRMVNSFIHRAGRTGRKGKEGLNVLLLTREKLDFAKECEQQLQIKFGYSNSMLDLKEEESLKEDALKSAMKNVN